MSAERAGQAGWVSQSVLERETLRGGRLLYPLDWLTTLCFALCVRYWRWRTGKKGWLSASGPS